jgi:NADH-quinone oxidoreductase subunit G
LISTFPGQPLDSKYSGNTVDICPVGALLNRDFRFQSRVWFVEKSPAICTGCANGCNVYLESRGNLIYRLLPRRNEEVNQVWMCDEGRLTYHESNEKRIETGDVGRAIELLRPIIGKPGIGISISAQCTNEEAAAAFLFGARVGAEKYFLTRKPPGDSDDFLIRADKNPNARGVELAAKAFGVRLQERIEGVKALVAFRTDGLPKLNLEIVIAIAQNESFEAQVALPCQSVYEQHGSLINYYGRLQRTWPGVPAQRGDSAPAWLWAERILTGLGISGAPRSVSAAFDLLGLGKFEQIPEEGVVFKELLPKEWPKRAPRPEGGAR